MTLPDKTILDSIFDFHNNIESLYKLLSSRLWDHEYTVTDGYRKIIIQSNLEFFQSCIDFDEAITKTLQHTYSYVQQYPVQNNEIGDEHYTPIAYIYFSNQGEWRGPDAVIDHENRLITLNIPLRSDLSKASLVVH